MRYLQCVLIGAVFAVLFIAMSVPFMLLWNYGVVPAVTFTTPIGYVEALNLLLFVSLFIGAGRATCPSK